MITEQRFNVLPRDLIDIYKLPKIHNKIPKYCQALFLTIILCPKSIFFLNYTPIDFIENVSYGTKDSFGTKFKKTLGRIFF